MADVAVGGGVVRTICEVFEGEGFHVPVEAGSPPDVGVRRCYVEHFLSSADWTRSQTQAAFARVAASAVEDRGRDFTSPPALTTDAEAFVRSARRDGIPLSPTGELIAFRSGAAIMLARGQALNGGRHVHENALRRLTRLRVVRTESRAILSASAVFL